LLAFFLAIMNSIIFACATPNYWLDLFLSGFLWAILVSMACMKLLGGFSKGSFHHEFPSSSKSMGTFGALLTASGYIFSFVYNLLVYFTGWPVCQGLFLLIITSMIQAGTLLLCLCIIMKAVSSHHDQGHGSHHGQQHGQVYSDPNCGSDLKP
jgi:hypothetical protein